MSTSLCLFGCKKKQIDNTISIYNEYFHEYRIYQAYSRKDLINYFIRYGETKKNAKSLEKHIFYNNRKEYNLEDKLIDFSCKLKKPYLVSLEDYNNFSEFIYIRKGTNFFVFPYLIDGPQILDELRENNYQFQYCTRKRFNDLHVYHRLYPKEAKKFEKWIYNIVIKEIQKEAEETVGYIDEQIISTNIKKAMQDGNIDYAIELSGYDEWNGELTVRKGDYYVVLNLYDLYTMFFPNNIEVKNIEEKLYILFNREGFIFYNMAGSFSRSWLALVEKEMMNNLVQENIVDDPLIKNLLVESNKNICLSDGIIIYYLRNDILYKINFDLLLTEFGKKITGYVTN